MSKMRWVNTDFWSDAWVVDHLNPLDRYLFIYLFTNPHTNVAGVYELSLRIMSFETGIERDELLRMVKRLEPKVHYIDGWVVLKNGIKNQNYMNSKIKAGILAALETVPSEHLQHVSWPKDFGSPKPEGSKQTQIFDETSMTHEGSSHSDYDTDTDSDIDSDSNSDAGKPRGFKKTITTPEQRRAYAKAAQADRDQEARAQATAGRKGSTTSLSELYKERRLNGKEVR